MEQKPYKALKQSIKHSNVTITSAHAMQNQLMILKHSHITKDALDALKELFGTEAAPMLVAFQQNLVSISIATPVILKYVKHQETQLIVNLTCQLTVMVNMYVPKLYAVLNFII